MLRKAWGIVSRKWIENIKIDLRGKKDLKLRNKRTCFKMAYNIRFVWRVHKCPGSLKLGGFPDDLTKE